MTWRTSEASFSTRRVSPRGGPRTRKRTPGEGDLVPGGEHGDRRHAGEGGAGGLVAPVVGGEDAPGAEPRDHRGEPLQVVGVGMGDEDGGEPVTPMSRRKGRTSRAPGS